MPPRLRFKRSLRPHLRLIALIGMAVPRRLRADWRQEWEAELNYRELLLADWDRLDRRRKLDLLWRSTSAFWDALWLQTYRWEEAMIQDVRYGARMLLKNPGFTLISVLSLALGIGANSAIFSLVDVVLLKALPVQEPEKLVLFGNAGDTGLTDGFPNRSWDLFSYPFYQDLRQRNEVFSGVSALLSIPWEVHGSVNTAGATNEPEKLSVQLVSGTYFPVLGVNAVFGRTLTEADDQIPGAHPVAVVSHAWWERRLAGDTTAVGQTILIDQIAYTIVGIAPKEFFGTTVGQMPDIWLPLAMEAQLPPARWNIRNRQLSQSLYLIARLKSGISTDQASAAVNLFFKQFLLEQSGPQPSPERLQAIQQATIELTPAGRGLSELRREFSLSLRILMVVVGLVLVIACANVANLLLARAAARQKEFAVRLAIGAGRTRLIRQLLTESLLLASMGGIAGVVLAWWASRLLVLMASAGAEPLPLDVSPNPRILGFTLLVSLLSAAIFGTAPALRAARIEPITALKGGKGSTHTPQSRFGKALVVAQVALSLLLLVAAGLFVRTLSNLQNVPVGFEQQNVMLFRVDPATTGLKGVQFAPLLREVEEKVMALPGVQGASFSFVIFNQGQWTSRVFTGEPDQPEGQRSVRQSVVGPAYFTTMGIPLLSGRFFGSEDTDKSQKVAIISESMAHRFFPNGSPLGKRFGTYGRELGEFEIIGVVKDAKYGTVTEELRPMAYYPHSQRPQSLNNFVVRTSGAQAGIVPQVRRAVAEVSRNLPIDDVVSLSEHIGRSLTQQKLVARLASFFGLLALLLACVGLYGVLSYSVARRTNEIGIRKTLGAQSRDVLLLVLRDTFAMVLIGVVIGLLTASYVTRIAESLLFGLKPTDPLTLATATVLLIVFAVFAGYLPARRATKVDPMVALRDE